jgi:ubiquinone/menaquinone biosynthesis C-methylase UbiE
MSSSDSHRVEYSDILDSMALVWGDGFMSPGGPEEVALLVAGIDLAGKHVLDIGCGVGGIDAVLVQRHGAALVTGVDVDPALIAQAKERAQRAGLDEQLQFRQIEPGPLPFADSTFDVAFSKDAVLHVQDKEALFAETYRVLRPGGALAISDWLRCDDQPSSPEMAYWLTVEGLSYVLASPVRYRRAIEAAGYREVEIVDRNPWYRELARNEYEQMSTGALHKQLVDLLGEQLAAQEIESWRAMNVVLESGELRPTHIHGRKPAG